ncbi:hypothetical protein B0H14DRAFT_2655337 [Mycena olivaceomarginata]|nr:hypothetical protein B0H14DRAFT_2655337 [Mycena olivaceomarginata]
MSPQNSNVHPLDGAANQNENMSYQDCHYRPGDHLVSGTTSIAASSAPGAGNNSDHNLRSLGPRPSLSPPLCSGCGCSRQCGDNTKCWSPPPHNNSNASNTICSVSGTVSSYPDLPGGELNPKRPGWLVEHERKIWEACSVQERKRERKQEREREHEPKPKPKTEPKQCGLQVQGEEPYRARQGHTLDDGEPRDHHTQKGANTDVSNETAVTVSCMNCRA